MKIAKHDQIFFYYYIEFDISFRKMSKQNSFKFSIFEPNEKSAEICESFMTLCDYSVKNGIAQVSIQSQ